MRLSSFLSASLGLLLGAPGCADDIPAGPVHGGVSPRSGLLSSAVTRVVFEVDYQPGAEPFTGQTGLLGRDTWGLFRTNIERIFQNSTPRELVIPASLDAMEALPGVSTPASGGFSVSAILDIAARHQQGRSTTAERSFYILFLDGRFEDAGGAVNGNVLGVSIGDTGVIAMFKPVIESSQAARYVEQTTLIHEVGHAIGLVENGLPATGGHHDAEHGAHCTNRDCVMHYLHEGAGELAGFVGRFVQSGDVVVFGSECLADIDAAAAR